MQHLKCQRLVTKALIQFRRGCQPLSQSNKSTSQKHLFWGCRAEQGKNLWNYPEKRKERQSLKNDFENLLVRFPRWRPAGSWSWSSCGTRRRTPAGPRCPWWAILNRAFLIPDIFYLTHSISDGCFFIFSLLQIKGVYLNLIYSNMASTVGSWDPSYLIWVPSYLIRYLMGKASFEFFSPEFADDDNTVAKVDVLLPRPKNGRPLIDDAL